MQVILVKDVPKVGKKGELVNVSDGYGRNFLLARGYANIASQGALRAIDKEKADKAAQMQREYENAKALGEKLKQASISIKARTGENGKLFGSITTADVAEAMAQQLDMTFDKRNIKIEAPIKQVGAYTVSLKLHSKVKATITLKVEEA